MSELRPAPKFPKPYTYSTDGPTCPNCGWQVTPDESFYYTDKYDSDDCQECETTFKVEVFTSTSWTCTAVEKVKS